VNKRHQYRALEREYITTDISIRELCRKHGISAHSLVTVQAKRGKWAAKREQYQAKESESFIEKHAERMAERQAQLHDKALDAIDQALDKFRDDMRATEKKRIGGEWIEVPVMRLKPKDVAILLDRLMVVFEKPSAISQHQGLTLTSELSVEGLREFIEATRGTAGPSRMEGSPLPRRRRLDD
jgi:transposase-like protein